MSFAREASTVFDVHVVEDTLGRLGDTPKDVGLTLMSEGVKGRRSREYSCAIANYLTAHFGGEWELHGDWGFQRGGSELFDVPFPVAMFIADFDTGQWPQLEEGGHR